MRVETQGGLHPCRQPVKALSHVGDAACQIDADIAWNANHDSADKTRRNAPSSTAPVKRSFTPEVSSTSIVPFAGRSGSGSAGTGSTGTATDASSSTGRANLTGANPVNSPVRNRRATGKADRCRSHAAGKPARLIIPAPLSAPVPKLLFEVPAPPPLRTSKNFAANLASPRTEHSRDPPFQPALRHPLHRPREESVRKYHAEIPLSARRPSADAYCAAGLVLALFRGRHVRQEIEFALAVDQHRG